ncbi:2562_t:CDS:2 [Funneliformis geosporum]|uniref:2562_t:CDS:1 n=1 Tax=Funneliformis geosporum TaxID=1117311 RepID=A0A9W4SH65_9GLOM|nr:2562_t:CDS:2 [Funneliformis geosporum]
MVIHKSSPVLHVKKVKRRNLEKAFYWYQQASDSEYGLGKNKPCKGFNKKSIREATNNGCEPTMNYLSMYYQHRNGLE